MLGDITSLKLKGANFDKITTLDFFLSSSTQVNKQLKQNGNSPFVKAALIYGKNGSGKSSIAKAFRKIKGEEVSSIIQADLYTDEDEELNLSVNYRANIFVFDEDYVSRNVKLQQDHLNTIALLGPAANLTEQIENAKLEEKKAKNNFDREEEKYREFTDSSNIKSPQYYHDKMMQKLRGDQNWSGRERKIQGYRTNASVNNAVLERILGYKNNKKIAELMNQFSEHIKRLRESQSGETRITIEVPEIPAELLSVNEETVINLLAERIEKPVLSDREKKLLTIVRMEGQVALDERLRMFSQNDVLACPYCLQPISKKYKRELIQSIENVLSEQVKNHCLKLWNCKLIAFTADLSPFQKLESFTVCDTLLTEVNKAIEYYNASIDAKCQNPYNPIKMESLHLGRLIKQLKIAFENLRQERISYNENIAQTKPIKEKLNKINAEWAYLEIQDLNCDYMRQQKAFDAQKDLYDSAKKKHQEFVRIVQELEAQRRSVKLAVEQINASMQYIFFAKDRLSIEYADNQYRLLSNGKPVKPCDVSVGERNIIALSYFFTDLLSGKDAETAYKDENLIVIDDPISSFDRENRIGILSFLKYKLSRFLLANARSRVIIMTHDLMVAFDGCRILSDIIQDCSTKQKTKFNAWELSNCTLKAFSFKRRQEYSELLKIVYDYASGLNNECELMIGNIMRQVLEAFSTFSYKKGIENVSKDDKILDLLHDVEYKRYFGNLMYRLALNGGSHREDEIKSMRDYRFFEVISPDEKKKTARDILCFIYLLNQRHILEYLGNDVNTKFSEWCNQIKSEAPQG